MNSYRDVTFIQTTLNIIIYTEGIVFMTILLVNLKAKISSSILFFNLLDYLASNLLNNFSVVILLSLLLENIRNIIFLIRKLKFCHNYTSNPIRGLNLLTIITGGSFLSIQLLEFYLSNYSIKDSFENLSKISLLATHWGHVLIGIILILIQISRDSNFKPKSNFNMVKIIFGYILNSVRPVCVTEKLRKNKGQKSFLKSDKFRILCKWAFLLTFTIIFCLLTCRWSFITVFFVIRYYYKFNKVNKTL